MILSNGTPRQLACGQEVRRTTMSTVNLPAITAVVAAVVIVVGRVRRWTPVAILGFGLLALAALLFVIRSR
jgi:ABC-type uncharacterized transport system permease subunit